LRTPERNNWAAYSSRATNNAVAAPGDMLNEHRAIACADLDLFAAVRG
jgi:hypothetical protein